MLISCQNLKAVLLKNNILFQLNKNKSILKKLVFLLYNEILKIRKTYSENLPVHLVFNNGSNGKKITG